jgi:hypothetical protein
MAAKSSGRSAPVTAKLAVMGVILGMGAAGRSGWVRMSDTMASHENLAMVKRDLTQY